MLPVRFLLLAGIACLVLLVSSPVSASVSWSVVDGQLRRNNLAVTLKGMTVTCMEYLLNGIGTDCLATNNFNNFSAVITTLNRQEMDKIYSILLPPPKETIQPAIRLNLNAGYFLDVPTPSWEVNRNKFPNLTRQYQTLIDLVVQDATSRNIVVIMDLHWSDDISQFSPMALKGSATSGDTETFWNQVATRYASNPFVFYELFNAPHIDSYSVWMEGDAQFEGMRKMTAAVLTKNVKGMLLVGGQRDSAYDAPSLLKYTTDINNKEKALFVFHPFMGPTLAQEVAKGLPGFIERVDEVLSVTKRPIVLTEMGQFCCPAEGACFVHPGIHEGVPAGYIRSILFEASKRNLSWMGVGYRPGSGGQCDQPDINDGGALYSAGAHGGLGANWVDLFRVFYPADSNNVPALAGIDNDEDNPDAGNNDIAIPIGAGLGGAVAVIGALGLFLRKRHHEISKRKRLETELAQWTENEMRALQEKWQVTHDFDELCSVVPHRTRESVAFKTKSFQQKTKSTFLQTFNRTASFVPSERFNFVYPKRPYHIPGPMTRGSNMPPSSSARNQGGKAVMQPYESGAYPPRNPHSPSVDSGNPMYINSFRTTVSY